MTNEELKTFLNVYFHQTSFNPEAYGKFLKILDDKEKFKAVENASLEKWNDESSKPHSRMDDPDKTLSSIHRKINLLSENKKDVFRIRIWNAYRKIAAGIMIPLLLISSILAYKAFLNVDEIASSAIVNIQSPKGARTSFTLPDGTNGWLASNSSISYEIDFMRKRKVELDGEAFFDVSNQPDNSFLVNASDLTIEVFGTRFNVMNNQNEDHIEVILEEGSIGYKINNSGKDGLLTPNQMLSYSRKNHETEVNYIDAANYTSWTEGTLVMRNENLERLAIRLTRFYGVDVVVVDDRIKDYKFWGVFRNEQLEEVLDLLALTSPLKYSIEPKALLPDGSFGNKTFKLEYNPNFSYTGR